MRKRILTRGADAGYSFCNDLGLKKVVDEGFCADVEIMLDAPNARDCLEFLKDRPWVSVSWHRHLWESPVLPPKEVPSLVDEEGRFKWRHNKNYLRKEATYEDSYKELRAEAELCYSIIGRYPEAAGVRLNGTELERAMADVCKDLDIDVTFWNRVIQCEGNSPRVPGPDGKFIDTLEDKKSSYDLAKFKDRHPENKFLNLKWNNEDEIYWVGGHPGYLDDHMLEESQCSIHRVQDVMVYFNPVVIDFLRKEKIEIVNIHDIKYGTHQYQDHLREIDSPLWIGNM